MFDRTIKLIGSDSLDLIKSKKIMLVGIGGVGGSILESLIRSGIENIILIDYDTVELSNLNRQVITNINNVGKCKVDVAYDFCKSINKKVNVEKYNLFLDETNIKKILEDEKPDYIVDACDSVKTKKALILEANKNKIKIISSMGTANKLKPSLLKITDINKTKNDPLAKIIRKWARDNSIKKLTVLSSDEIPINKGKTLSTMCFVPNVAGILIANYIIMDIINKKY